MWDKETEKNSTELDYYLEFDFVELELLNISETVLICQKFCQNVVFGYFAPLFCNCM